MDCICGHVRCQGKGKCQIFNLTQHSSTPAQIQSGVVEPTPDDKKRIKELLTFDSLEEASKMLERAWKLFNIIDDNYDGITAVMLGAAPFFVPALVKESLNRTLTPLFAFSKRESVEEKQPDGSVVKRSVFKHVGFVYPWGHGG